MAQRSERPISCIILDVDWFGRYNEHYGHPAGDAALQDIAKILQAKVNRETDTLCRYGGEEFAVLLNDTNYEAAKNIARKLIDAVSSLDIAHEGSETAMVITASAGVATLMPAPGDSAHELVLRADNALYRAKSQGRNQFA